MEKNVLYKVTCTINGKVYIGITTRGLRERKAKHKHAAFTGNSQQKICRAFRKYGWENFTWEILATFETVEELFQAEIDAIKKYDSTKTGFNISLGGEATRLGYKCTPEEVEKMRNTMLSWMEANPEKHKKMVDQLKENIQREDVRKKMVESHKKFLEENPEKWQETLKKRVKSQNEKEFIKKASKLRGGRPINVFQNGILINRYESLGSLRKELKIDGMGVKRCINDPDGKAHVRGYTFKYTEEEISPAEQKAVDSFNLEECKKLELPKFSISNWANENPERAKEMYKSRVSKKPKPLDVFKDGEFVNHYESASEAAMDLGLIVERIRQCLSVKCHNKTHKGYAFRYTSPECETLPTESQTSPEGVLV